MDPGIFISYRRDDAAGDAGRLADHLHRRFGAAQVFLDIEAIAPGTDFVQALSASLQRTAAMLVVIGPRWLTLRTADGRRRLDDPDDFVRREVETALGRGIPVVPVLVQGAALPRIDELPAALAPLATRQAVSVDHAEFHDDAERLCDRLAPFIRAEPDRRGGLQRHWRPAAIAIAALVAALGVYALLGTADSPPLADAGEDDAAARQQAQRIEALVAEAAAQRRRDQFSEALATLARARAAAPEAADVQRLQEDVAMDWIRGARVEDGKGTFGETIKPALAVVDAALATAAAQRRADLLAHSGWATFLMWRDGNRQLDPADWYREALAVEPANPYANAMLGHWLLFRDDDVAGATSAFARALQSGRATAAVRSLQWSGYANTTLVAADVEMVRVADAMRRKGEAIDERQAQMVWRPYFFALPKGRMAARNALLESLPPDDHIQTIEWALADYVAGDDGRRRTIRFYIALLHARAARAAQARADLQALRLELTPHPGSLRDAVDAALQQMPADERGSAVQ